MELICNKHEIIDLFFTVQLTWSLKCTSFCHLVQLRELDAVYFTL